MSDGSWRETWALTAKLAQTLTHQILASLDNRRGQPQPLNLLSQGIWLAALTELALFMINGRKASNLWRRLIDPSAKLALSPNSNVIK